MKRPVNQHWVPQFYLKGFATRETRNEKESQVWIFSRNDSDGDECLTNVRNVCAKRYLYSPKNKCGVRSWETDERLNGIESLLSSVWSAVATGFIDLGDESFRKALALFVASMHLRHPEVLDKVAALHGRMVSWLNDAPKSDDGIPNIGSLLHCGKEYRFDPSGWEEYKSWGKDDHHRFFNDLVLRETGRFAKLLLKKRWSVVFSETDQLITSDRPVNIRDGEARNCGVNSPGAIASFPLSPSRMLILDDNFNEPANQYYPLRVENIGAFNLGTWHATARFLITGRSVRNVLEEMLLWADREETLS
jgi:hypothetical protein